MNKKIQRLNQLIEILKVRHYVSVKELASHLEVSEMTIRRDLEILKSKQIAENIAGISVYNSFQETSPTQSEYNLSSEHDKHFVQKNAIAQFAASLIKQGEIIILDTGSTTEKIVPFIPKNSNLTILCYNMNILTKLHRRTDIQIILAGGIYHANTQLFESPEGIEFIRGIRAQKLFLSAAGIHSSLGITCANQYEVPGKQAVLGSSMEHILVADSSKFGSVKCAFFCNLSDIDVIVTDDSLSQEWCDIILALGIELHLV
ncbi:MAG: DeoR/GlpR family DNA-binding transcription regulator [Clostridia bacterium]